MRAKTVLTLRCLLILLVAVAMADAAKPLFSRRAVTKASCPASVYQQCYQRYGTCALCFCSGSICSCENRCQ